MEHRTEFSIILSEQFSDAVLNHKAREDVLGFMKIIEDHGATCENVKQAFTELASGMDSEDLRELAQKCADDAPANKFAIEGPSAQIEQLKNALNDSLYAPFIVEMS